MTYFMYKMANEEIKAREDYSKDYSTKLINSPGDIQEGTPYKQGENDVYLNMLRHPLVHSNIVILGTQPVPGIPD